MWKHNIYDITILLVSASCSRGQGENYAGTIAVTENGDPCQRWDINTPHENNHKQISKYPGAISLAEIKNYCRNPSESVRPWCYTTNEDVRWDYCSIPCCFGK